jgi:tyrosyl-tRNA synthetase
MARLKAGIPAFKLLHEIGLAASGAAARRLIDQGGAYVNGVRIDDHERVVSDRDLGDEGALVLRAGKKRFHRVCVAK